MGVPLKYSIFVINDEITRSQFNLKKIVIMNFIGKKKLTKKFGMLSNMGHQQSNLQSTISYQIHVIYVLEWFKTAYGNYVYFAT